MRNDLAVFYSGARMRDAILSANLCSSGSAANYARARNYRDGGFMERYEMYMDFARSDFKAYEYWRDLVVECKKYIQE